MFVTEHILVGVAIEKGTLVEIFSVLGGHEQSIKAKLVEGAEGVVKPAGKPDQEIANPGRAGRRRID